MKAKFILKRFFFILLLFIVALAAYHHKMTGYLLRQLHGQLHMMWNAELITNAIQSPEYSDEQKQKLKLIEKICDYAYDSIGLANHQNYTSVYNQHGKHNMFVITACEPFALNAYRWNYPLLGELNYKGFFDSTAAHSEMKKLQKLGYDASLGYASGWSTLGWLKDPILSNMLKRSEGQLAELIIHELVHGTVFKKGDERFNENFATFVSEYATPQFLETIDTNSDSLYYKYISWRTDEIIYGQYLLYCTDSLKKFYKIHSLIASTQAKKLKTEKITQLMMGIDSLPLSNRARYQWNAATDSLPDNTFFMDNAMYREMLEGFSIELKNEFNNDIRKMIKYYQKKYPPSLW